MVYGNDETQISATVVVRKDGRLYSLLDGLESKVLVSHGMVTAVESEGEDRKT
jgi:hypothetical protein